MCSEDLEWRLIYVGSAKSEEYDQELDSCMGESAGQSKIIRLRIQDGLNETASIISLDPSLASKGSKPPH